MKHITGLEKNPDNRYPPEGMSLFPRHARFHTIKEYFDAAHVSKKIPEKRNNYKLNHWGEVPTIGNHTKKRTIFRSCHFFPPKIIFEDQSQEKKGTGSPKQSFWPSPRYFSETGWGRTTNKIHDCLMNTMMCLGACDRSLRPRSSGHGSGSSTTSAASVTTTRTFGAPSASWCVVMKMDGEGDQGFYTISFLGGFRVPRATKVVGRFPHGRGDYARDRKYVSIRGTSHYRNHCWLLDNKSGDPLFWWLSLFSGQLCQLWAGQRCVQSGQVDQHTPSWSSDIKHLWHIWNITFQYYSNCFENGESKTKRWSDVYILPQRTNVNSLLQLSKFILILSTLNLNLSSWIIIHSPLFCHFSMSISFPPFVVVPIASIFLLPSRIVRRKSILLARFTPKVCILRNSQHNPPTE